MIILMMDVVRYEWHFTIDYFLGQFDSVARVASCDWLTKHHPHKMSICSCLFCILAQVDDEEDANEDKKYTAIFRAKF